MTPIFAWYMDYVKPVIVPFSTAILLMRPSVLTNGTTKIPVKLAPSSMVDSFVWSSLPRAIELGSCVMLDRRLSFDFVTWARSFRAVFQGSINSHERNSRPELVWCRCTISQKVSASPRWTNRGFCTCVETQKFYAILICFSMGASCFT